MENIDQVISLRLALLKELDEIKSDQEEHLIVTATREYLDKALAHNEFISYVAESGEEG
ncbi:hypothetical protein [Bacillus sp. FJAT-42315]|uniref:hypothetical protein n=1 Tax=Bacillus sp. FJAT-42315 TaxID=2014077 RepID=UPI0012FF0866|nr:hypothetical protein [Bacillus sp. FJAT-42315]